MEDKCSLTSCQVSSFPVSPSLAPHGAGWDPEKPLSASQGASAHGQTLYLQVPSILETTLQIPM